MAPDDLGATRLGPLEATYVSSSTTGDWLDRVAAHDLGSRSAAQVEVLTTARDTERHRAEQAEAEADTARQTLAARDAELAEIRQQQEER